MSNLQSEVSNEADLYSVKKIADEFGYKTELFEQSKGIAYPVLSVISGKDKYKNPVQLTFMFYPIDKEMPNSNLLQVFTQMGFEIEDGEASGFHAVLPIINNRLPIGHFSLLEGINKVQFRYVHTFPKMEALQKDNVNDIIVMSNYIVVLFAEVLFELANGKLLVHEAIAKVNKIYDGQ